MYTYIYVCIFIYIHTYIVYVKHASARAPWSAAQAPRRAPVVDYHSVLYHIKIHFIVV